MANPPSPTTFRTLFLLALGGFSANLLMLVRRLSDETASLAGCGTGSGCDAVLGSQWSQVLGIPVTVFGMLVYAGLMLALTRFTRFTRFLLAPLLGVIFMAAVWFIIVQAMIVKAFCPWCMAAHMIGILLTALGLPLAAATCGSWKNAATDFTSYGLAGIIALIVLQLFGPKPAAHDISEIPPQSPAEQMVMNDAHAAGSGRLVTFFDGRKGYRVEELPHLGRVDAPHVIVEYFDYTCLACRTMGKYLESLIVAYPDEVCVILLPVPLEHACNNAMPTQAPDRPGACELARTALAVWRSSPENFKSFHTAILANPDINNAKNLAKSLLADSNIPMEEAWIDAVIENNISDWRAISGDNLKLPKLVLKNSRILHGFPPTKEEFMRVISSQLGLN